MSDFASTQRIMIVDDDEVMLATTQAVLQGMGYEVVTHSDPFSAATAIRNASPDLVLLDVNMPGLSGIGLADCLKGRGSQEQTRLFFFSSEDDESLEAAVKKAGVDGYIRKGNRTELRLKVSRALMD